MAAHEIPGRVMDRRRIILGKCIFFFEELEESVQIEMLEVCNDCEFNWKSWA